jgi:hypothetical protein
MNCQKFDMMQFMQRRSMNFEMMPLYRLFTETLPLVVPLSSSGPWVAGGAVMKTLINQPLDTDVDVWFNNAKQFDKAYKLMEAEFKRVKETNWAATFEVNEFEVQLIAKGFYQTAEMLISEFDITVCQFAWDGTKLYCGEYSQADLATRLLKTHHMNSPHTTALRCLKYATRGFKMLPQDMEALNKAAMDVFIQSDIQGCKKDLAVSYGGLNERVLVEYEKERRRMISNSYGS